MTVTNGVISVYVVYSGNYITGFSVQINNKPIGERLDERKIKNVIGNVILAVEKELNDERTL